MGDDRVGAVQDRVGPPRERPDEDLRIREQAADEVPLRVVEHRDRKEEKGDQQVQPECRSPASAVEQSADALHASSVGVASSGA